MHEIGGYLGFEELTHHEYYSGLTALNTARSALLYLIRGRGIRKLYIPYYLCSSVAEALEREGCAYGYYHVGEDFMPDFCCELQDREYIYIVNYYGRLTNKHIAGFKARFGRIIIDNVQAFFQKPLEGVDTIYSCRKFFGVPDGAYLSSDVRLNPEPEQSTSASRMKHILGRCEGRSASDYYNDFRESDDSLASVPVMKMSWITHNILGAVDYEQAKSKRGENHRTLHSVLGRRNKIPEFFPEGAFMYPFYCVNGLAVRKVLASKKIYVPVLWPGSLECGDRTAEDFSANILPLPCDQRYDREDMIYAAEEVMKVCTG